MNTNAYFTIVLVLVCMSNAIIFSFLAFFLQVLVCFFSDQSGVDPLVAIRIYQLACHPGLMFWAERKRLA